MPPLPVQRLWRCYSLAPCRGQNKKETSFEASFYFRVFRGVLALLEDGGNALAAADAEGGKTLLGVVTLEHFVQQGDDDTSTGSADGVADGDRAAVDVDLAHVEVQLTGNRDGLGREGFVGLDEVDILDGQAGLLHGLTGSGHGADAHDLRVDAALAPADELGHGLEVVLLHGLAGSEDDGGSAVVDAGGVTGGDALDVLLGIGFVDAGGLEGVDDLVLNALRTDGERAAQLGKTLDGGTEDSSYLFDRFIQMMGGNQ